MPIIKSAKKKMRKDRKRTLHNKRQENKLKTLVKTMRRNPSTETLTPVFSSLDKAVKTDLIHPNKAARLKSRLTKLIQTQA
jgi:small subunit ribosomal protein S20